MNKFTKWVGASFIVLIMTILLHKDDAKHVKTFFIKTQQLINRLIEQVKDSKKDLIYLNKVIQKANLFLLINHVHQFNDAIQPSLNKIHQRLEHLKNNYQK